MQLDGLCSASERVVGDDVVGAERALFSVIEAQRRLQLSIAAVLQHQDTNQPHHTTDVRLSPSQTTKYICLTVS